MNTSEIVAHLDAEISRLQQAKALLLDAAVPAKRGPGRPAGSATASKTAKVSSSSKAGRNLSREARARIAAAQKLRWEKSRKSAAADTRTAVTSKTKTSSRSVSKPAAKRPAAKKAGRPKSKATQPKPASTATPVS